MIFGLILALGICQDLRQAAADLAPSWSSYSSPVSLDQKNLSRETLLGALLSEQELNDEARWMARLVPHLTTEDVQACAALLQTNASSSLALRRARDLLLAARDSLAGAAIGSLALDSAVATEARAFFLMRRMRVEGVTWRLRAANALLPEDLKLLRVLAEESARRFGSQDREILRTIAQSFDTRTSMTALLGWAEGETDAAQRLELYDQIAQQSPAQGRRLLGALARGGPHEEIQARLAAEISSPDPERRALAEDFLPSFLEPDALVKVYRRQLDSQLHPQLRAQRMVRLARLPSPAARALASHWLADGGWAQGRLGRQVAILLSTGPDPGDSWERLFETPRVPQEILRPLALGRAPQSVLARAWLRNQVETQSDDVSSLVHALAKSEDAVDIQFLADLLADPGMDEDARVSACEGLARFPSFRSVLQARLEDPGEDYPVVEAVLRALIVGGDCVQRQDLGPQLASIRSERPADEALGLLLAELDAREQKPLASEALPLATRLALLLAQVPVTSSGLPPNPRQGAGRFPRVHACGRALAAAIRVGGTTTIPPVGEVSSDAILHVLAVLPATHGESLVDFLLQQEALSESGRLRALAARFRIQSRTNPVAGARTLADLLSDRSLLLADPKSLAFGLGEPDALAWILTEDRLAERIPLLRTWENPEQMLAAFRSWQEGSPSPQAILQAQTKMLAVGATSPALQILLRGLDFHSEHTALRLALGRIYQTMDRLPEAGTAFATAHRLAFPGSRQQEEAELGMRACGYDGG